MSIGRSPLLRSLLLALLGVAGLALLDHGVRADLTQPRDLHQVAYTGSANCLRCHRDHEQSWRVTYHRTMTQSASEASVKGDFTGKTLDYFGVRARMERSPSGGYVVRYGGQGFPEQRFEVQKTVGSRRYQQYVAQSGSELVRLPIAFDLEAQRWFHMNGAFLTTDPDPNGPLSRADYERHLTRWNDNCVFCHNVAPSPGKRMHGFETQVAELGIACEACHGPGEEHARRNQNPLRRFTLHLGDASDPTIVNPARLPHDRAADVCGRCHGQRITDDVESFLVHGDPFVPGEDLALYSAPLWRDTTLQGQARVFESRFWGDGTPRLTAYEYQGLLQSPCYQRGELTCTSCHGMHEGDPKGQLREFAGKNQMCTGCHQRMAPETDYVAHARHGDSPPDCVSCHMPAIVYGVLSTHPSHRIETPDPARAERDQRPDACTLCHTDRSRAWAARERDRLFATKSAMSPAETPWSEAETQLFAGDPIQRAIAARALGKAREMFPSRPIARISALLLEVMEHDPYPVVRRFAARSLAALQPGHAEALAGFVPEIPRAARTLFVSALKAKLGNTLPELAQETMVSLRARASSQAIDIGE